MQVSNLSATEYGAYYQKYIDLVPAEINLLEGLKSSMEQTATFFEQLPDNRHEHRYEEGKWNPKEILQHLMDTERIFAYRALRIARMDHTPILGFDHNRYVDVSEASRQSIPNLVQSYRLLRLSNHNLFQSFTNEMLVNTGTASDLPISVRALGFIMLGHERHHINIIKERYL